MREYVLFGQKDPETTRVKHILMADADHFRVVDIDSSEGAQEAIRCGVRVSPVVYVYQDGDVVGQVSAGNIQSMEDLHVA